MAHLGTRFDAPTQAAVGDTYTRRSPSGVRNWYVFLPCGDCGVARWTMKWRPGKRCRRCQGRKSQAAIASRLGEASPFWRGGRRSNDKGYVEVYVPRTSPYVAMAPKRPDKTYYVLEHRLVMAQHLGRPLEDHETVHHKNGDRQDNRIENLELWAGRHPSGVRLADFTCPSCGHTCPYPEAAA